MLNITSSSNLIISEIFSINFDQFVALKRCLAPPKVGFAQCAHSGTPAGPALTIQKAYFDKVLEKCSWFVYLGCGGSDNQFASIEECNATCMSSEALTTIRKSMCHLFFCLQLIFIIQCLVVMMWKNVGQRVVRSNKSSFTSFEI